MLVAHPIPLPIQDKPLLVDNQAAVPPPAKKAGRQGSFLARFEAKKIKFLVFGKLFGPGFSRSACLHPRTGWIGGMIGNLLTQKGFSWEPAGRDSSKISLYYLYTVYGIRRIPYTLKIAFFFTFDRSA